MKPKIRQRLLGLLALWACATGHANERDWLYFPMYHNDTAHAVHYKALRLRPDGLLQGATRYPGHSPEGTWSKPDWDRASYEYYTQLIDCDTGLSVDTSHQLITDTGETVAKRELGRADWIDDIVRTGQTGDRHVWPSNSEIFLACTGYRDERLKKARTGNSSTVPFIGFERQVTNLANDSRALAAKSFFSFNFDGAEKASARQPERLFDGMRQQYRNWLSGFMRTQGGTTQRLAPAPAGAQARAVEWLNERGLAVTSLTVRPDGSIEMAEEIRGFSRAHAPDKARSATRLHEQMLIDCHSGVVVSNRALWTDDAGKVLLRQTLPWKDVFNDVQRRYGLNGMDDSPVLKPWRGGEDGRTEPARLICAAAAAQCTGEPPAVDDEPLVFSEDDFPGNLTTPEAVLLHAHALWQQRRSRHVPTCTF